MKKLVIIVLLLITGLILTSKPVSAKIWSKNLINKATLSNGFLASICPTSLLVTDVLDPVVRMETDDVPVMTDSDCSGKDEEVLFGDITLTFKEGGEGKEYIVLYNDELLRADSFQYEYYKDWSLGALAPPNADGHTYHGLKSVMADTLYKIDINVPELQEKISNSGFKTIYGKKGEIDHTYFVFKSKVYKVAEIKKVVTDKVLIDYTTREPDSTPAQQTDMITNPTTKPVATDTINSWKTYTDAKQMYTIKYPSDWHVFPNIIGGIIPGYDGTVINSASTLEPHGETLAENGQAGIAINISGIDKTEDDSLLEYVNKHFSSPDITNPSYTQVKINGVQGIKYIRSAHELDSGQPMYYISNKNTVYTINVSVKNPAYESVVNQILQTFTFTK